MLVHSLPDIALLISCAIVVDWVVGDPRWPMHPVILIGRWISRLEEWLYRSPEHGGTPAVQRLRGTMLALLTILASFGLMACIIWTGYWIHEWLGFVLEVWFISTTIAAKGLKDAAMKVYMPLKAGDIENARLYTGYIVGRDTNDLTEAETARAAVETVAENTVDAFVSPLIFALIGGAPLAMLYRSANTLDSMVGYKNTRYIDFGWFSARLDDWLNFIPARLTGLLLVISAAVCRGMSASRAFRSIRQFARLHPSPNSGIPESAVAGALGIELGGINRYFGQPSERARMGWPIRPLHREDILAACRLLYIVSVIWFTGGAVIWLWLQ
ncbi:adenosylcobinamide-phosphate synthase CbiB [Paenibacillus tarimensis]|uniref:adenosylcobinamide-phosphate synthase CbiB n=1 Tax=Paenibacillus tarimensis TaxID=416012 RepID=UPI001F16910F|nr:adenosylcobinamide-phosphate synthase CbiB [Paenibacillus tarimensis]MCF2944798.1 adenosylcobinamide-phosphate synthase CbiB [Paenibacillus tarimensis]